MRHLHKLKHFHKKVRPHHVVSGLAVAGIAVVAMNLTHAPLFNSLDRFVLFASDKIQLAQGVQVSSGDLGSNKTIDIQKDAIVNGNLFADTIMMGKSTQVNGNVAANRLKLSASSTIFGSTPSSVSLPIANLPQVPTFTIGTQDFTFTGATSTLSAGSYRTITIAPSSTLTLSGGTYRLRALDLKNNATLIFNAPTILNIQFKLKGKDDVSILPGPNLKPDDLKINYLGIRSTKDKTTEDDDGEIASLLDQQEKKDLKAGKIGRPVLFGKGAFLNFKLLAPKANVNLNENTTLLGQVLAKRIKVGKGMMLSREEDVFKESDPANILEKDGVFFQGDEILLLLKPEANLQDAITIANLVGARVVGTVTGPNIFQLEIPALGIVPLDVAIATIKSSGNPLVIEAAKNFVFTVD